MQKFFKHVLLSIHLHQAKILTAIQKHALGSSLLKQDYGLVKLKQGLKQGSKHASDFTSNTQKCI